MLKNYRTSLEQAGRPNAEKGRADSLAASTHRGLRSGHTMKDAWQTFAERA